MHQRSSWPTCLLVLRPPHLQEMGLYFRLQGLLMLAAGSHVATRMSALLKVSTTCLVLCSVGNIKGTTGTAVCLSRMCGLVLLCLDPQRPAKQGSRARTKPASRLRYTSPESRMLQKGQS